MSHPLGHRARAFARTTPTAFVAVLLLLAAVLLTALLQPGTTSAGSIPNQANPSGLQGPDPNQQGTIVAPPGEGADGVDFEGTVPGPASGGVNAAACVEPANAYIYELTITGVTPTYYDNFTSQLQVRILWDPSIGEVATQDLALFLTNESGTTLGSSDGSDTQEFVLAEDLPNGVYNIIACSFATVLPQPFNGLATFNVTATSGAPTLPDPEVADSGIRFSATTVVEPQRDVAEPSLRVDGDYNVYACGPFGASRAAEYANKSEDFGDTFRVLGTPPEGRIAPGGGGDCELSVGNVRNPQGEFTLSYTGLEALANFSTGRSLDAGRTFTGTNVASEEFGVDRQWMETAGEQEVYLGFNALLRGYVVARSTDGGLTYGSQGVAASNIFRPGPIRIDQNEDGTRNPEGDNEIVYFTFTRADSVWVARSYDDGQTWEEFEVDNGFNPNNLFSALAIDTAGNLYAAWTEKGNFNTYYAYSLRPTTGAGGAGETWSEKRLVNRAPVYSTVMPWIEAGTPGNISVSYYGSPSDGNIEIGNFNAYWHVYVSTSFNALDAVDASGNVPFALTQATTHPVHYDSICVSGLGCSLQMPAGDRTLLDFFQNRLDPAGHIHIVFNQSNKVPGAEVGRIAIVTYVKQVDGPSLLGIAPGQRGPTGPAFPDPRPTVRGSSADPTGDAQFSFSTFGPVPPTRINMPALDITNFTIRPTCTRGVEAGRFDLDLELTDISDTALAEALAVQGASGSPAGSLLFVVRFFSGTDPYSAVAKWTPGVGFTFGFNDLTLDPTGRLEIYPGNDATIIGQRVNDTTLRMTVSPSQFQSLVLPAQPDGDPIFRPAVVGDRIHDVTAFTFGNTSADPEVQSYLNQGDSTAPFDHVLQPLDPQTCAPTAVTLGAAGTTPVQRDWLPLLAAMGALVTVGGLALARRRIR